jgi:hypothetical protein
MLYHILNGDCLHQLFKSSNIPGEFIICRECFIEGPVSTDDSPEFRNIRAEYISSTYNSTFEEYKSKVIDEFSKLDNIIADDEVYLWFEDDLFCQVNMWFILSELSKRNVKNIYRIFPISSDENKWQGFAHLTAEDLTWLIQSKVKFIPEDIKTGKHLWENYCNNDFEKLKQLSHSGSNCFKHLDEVVQAHIERFSFRPQTALKKVISSEEKDFNKISAEFNTTEAIYGFGDLQVKLLLKSL